MAGPHRPAPRRRRAAGQVLPAAIFLLLACGAFLYWTVNSGQMVVEKMRLTNAADAAAYSAGIVQARALNYDAYTNRAVIANEIAVAQALTVASWSDYFSDLSCNLSALGNAVNSTAPGREEEDRWALLAAFAAGNAWLNAWSGNSVCTGVLEATETLNVVVGPVASGFAGAAQAIAATQHLLHAGLSAPTVGMSREAAQRVVRDMDPRMEAEVLVTSLAELPRFVQSYAGDDRDRLMDVVHRSRDPFTARREWSIGTLPSEMRRRGGTFLADPDNWVAFDSLVHRQLGRGGISTTTIASGDVNLSNQEQSRSESSQTSFTFYGLFVGLPAIHDLSDTDVPEDPRGPRFGVSVLVSKPVSTTLTSGGAAVARPSGRLAAFDAPGARDQLTALSRAEVLFERPPRADGRVEYASLYQPYWQVRLVRPTEQDRIEAAARHGGVGLP